MHQEILRDRSRAYPETIISPEENSKKLSFFLGFFFLGFLPLFIFLVIFSKPSKSFEAKAQTTSGDSLGGYTTPLSVAPGENLDLHLSNNKASFDLTVWKEGAIRQLVTTINGVQATRGGCAGKSATGCGWPVSHTFTIPSDWKSGVYSIDMPTSTNTKRIIFWVKPVTPGAISTVLFLSSVNTYNAYNDVGGGSLYGFGDTDKITKVSFDRPFQTGMGQFDRWEKQFVIWAEQNGFVMDYVTTYDLHKTPDLLSNYDVVIIAGHSEYWSWPMRRQMEQFIIDGGRLMNLSGNTMWWQVRFEPNSKGTPDRIMVGYKGWKKDSIKTPAETTDLNWNYPIKDGSFKITGLDWRYGGYPGNNGKGFYAINTSHWIYTGTDITENSSFGKGSTVYTSIHDKESDGGPFNCGIDGQTILGTPGNTGTPNNFITLGLIPLPHNLRTAENLGTMGFYTNENNGAVFSAGTTGWALGLTQPTVSKITKNVLEKFIAGDFLLEESKPNTDMLFYDAFNCSDLQSRIGTGDWQKHIHKYNYTETTGADTDRYTAACGVSGTGLQMTMTAGKTGKKYTSMIKPDWGESTTLYTRKNLNFSTLTMDNTSVFTFMRLGVDNGEPLVPESAAVEVSKPDGKLSIRYRANNQSTPWIQVPGSTFLLETWFDKPNNTIALWINGVGNELIVPLTTVPTPNRVDYGVVMKKGNVGGKSCIDELIFNDSRPL